MPTPKVLVVGETPSLGRSLADLLGVGDIPAEYVHDLENETPLATLAHRYPVVVAASNGPFCTTARRWTGGELPDVVLVVVGSRDPAVLANRSAKMHLVPLPLLPARFLEMILDLMRSAPNTSSG